MPHVKFLNFPVVNSDVQEVLFDLVGSAHPLACMNTGSTMHMRLNDSEYGTRQFVAVMGTRDCAYLPASVDKCADPVQLRKDMARFGLEKACTSVLEAAAAFGVLTEDFESEKTDGSMSAAVCVCRPSATRKACERALMLARMLKSSATQPRKLYVYFNVVFCAMEHLK